MPAAFPRSPRMEKLLASIRERWIAAGCPGGVSDDAFIRYAVRGFDTEEDREKHALAVANYLWATRLGDVPSPN